MRVSPKGFAIASAVVFLAAIAGCSLDSSDDAGSSLNGSDGGAGGGNGRGGATHDAGAGHEGGPGQGSQDGAAPSGDSGGTPGTDSGVTPADSGSQPEAGNPGDGFDQFQHHNLDVMNAYRAGMGIAPLVLDAQLSSFALAGSQEESQDHIPHQHFNDAAANGTWTSSGFGTQGGEDQGSPTGWPQQSTDAVTNELTQIDQILAMMYAEGPGAGEAHGHYMNIMNSAFTRLGVGLLEINGLLYLTNDLSN